MPTLTGDVFLHLDHEVPPPWLCQESGFSKKERSANLEGAYSKKERSPRARQMSFRASKLDDLGGAVEHVFHPTFSRVIIHQLTEINIKVHEGG